VLIIDGFVGPTENDVEMLKALEERKKNVVIVANKVDKIKKSEYEAKFRKIRDAAGAHMVIPYSAEKKIGISDLTKEILK